jgi:hypothetical protein
VVMTLFAIPLVVFLGMTAYPAAESNAGLVVGAPHDGFDMHTGGMAREVAEELGWGCVVAEGYRSRRRGRWFDVNRPTQRPHDGEGFADARETDQGRAVYEEYQAQVYVAAGVEEGPLELLVELHGNSRGVVRGGRRVALDVIELATTGFSDRELRQLRDRFGELCEELPPGTPEVLLVIDELDPSYEFQGERERFYFRATGARTEGALRPECTRRALHFEMPLCVRSEGSREAYSALLVELLRFVRSELID